MTDNCTLTLLVPPEVRDDLTDWLLAFHHELTFTSQVVDHHGADPAALGTAEQVSGHQRRLRVEVQVSGDGVAPLLEELKREFPGAGWAYWVVPVQEAGRMT